MLNFGEKAKIKKAGNLNKGRSYVITAVTGGTHCGKNGHDHHSNSDF